MVWLSVFFCFSDYFLRRNRTHTKACIFQISLQPQYIESDSVPKFRTIGLYSHRYPEIAFEAYSKAHPCLRTIGQSEFNYQGIMVGSSHFDRKRFNEVQTSIVDVVDIMTKDGGSIVFAKSHRLQI